MSASSPDGGDLPNRPTSGPAGGDLPNRPTTAVEVQDLVFAYPGGSPVLRALSFSIGAGEKVALMGPNGAGKSTLLLHLNGILKGSGGRIRVAGLEVAEPNLGRVRAAVGLVFQDPDDQLFSPTVEEDVAFGPLYMGCTPDEVGARVSRSLAAVGMSGYQKRVSYHLSGGEKKRVAIATVLAMDPAILVLDEPTAGLDPRARRALIRLLATLPQTMLVSTHDLALAAELFPRSIVLDAGTIAADGPTAAILGDERLLEERGLKA